MTTQHFITVLDAATFQVEEIRAVTIDLVNGRKIRIYLKSDLAPFEYELDSATVALETFQKINIQLHSV
jgi:hypothetical protein